MLIDFSCKLSSWGLGIHGKRNLDLLVKTLASSAHSVVYAAPAMPDTGLGWAATAGA